MNNFEQGVCTIHYFEEGYFPEEVIEIGSCNLIEDQIIQLENHYFELLNFYERDEFFEINIGMGEDEGVVSKYSVGDKINLNGNYYSLTVIFDNVSNSILNYSYKLVLDSCIDNDSGENIGVFGEVEWRGQKYNDFCLDENNLEEYFCVLPVITSYNFSSPIAIQEHFCSGGCVNGICLEKEQITCVDSDRGLEKYSQGRVFYGDLVFNDECISEDNLTEYYCNETEGREEVFSKNMTCDYRCENGRCIEEVIGGEDEEGVENINEEIVKFESVEKNSQEVVCEIISETGKKIVEYLGDQYESECISERNLVEYSCEDGELIRESIECEFICEDGVCIDSASEDCEGCILEGNCYPVGFRKSKYYCNEEKAFVLQNGGSGECMHDYQCRANICEGGICSKISFFEKIGYWFRGLFG